MFSFTTLSSNCRLLLTVALLSSVLSAGCAGLDTGGPSARSLIIKKTAAYEEGGDIRRNIKEECELEERLPSVIRKYAERHYDAIYMMDRIPPVTPAKVLTLKISGVSAEKSKGILFGQNTLTVEGILTQNGNVIGSFTDFRVMGKRPMTEGYRGICYLLNRSAKRVGKDIGGWLAKPSMNATLGSARRLKKEMISSPEPAADPDDTDDDEK